MSDLSNFLVAFKRAEMDTEMIVFKTGTQIHVKDKNTDITTTYIFNKNRELTGHFSQCEERHG